MSCRECSVSLPIPLIVAVFFCITETRFLLRAIFTYIMALYLALNLLRNGGGILCCTIFFLERWSVWPSTLKNNHLSLWIEHWPLITHMKSNYFKFVLSSYPFLDEFQFVFYLTVYSLISQELWKLIDFEKVSSKIYYWIFMNCFSILPDDF